MKSYDQDYDFIFHHSRGNSDGGFWLISLELDLVSRDEFFYMNESHELLD